MNGKIKMYLGLALVLVVSAMATVGLFAFSAAPTAEASITSSLTGVAEGEGPRGIGERTTTQVAEAVTGLAVVQSPTDPGAPAKYTITFQTPRALSAGSDTIIINFDSEIKFPAVLDRNNISISSDAVVQVNSVGQPGSSVSPLDVTTRILAADSNSTEVTLTVPDMDPSDNTGGNAIAAAANVTVIFRQSAGLTNATEGGSDDVDLKTSQSTTNSAGAVVTPRYITISDDDGARGSTITIIGKGFKNSTTTTFWRDANADGLRTSGEQDLCSAVTDSSDIATCSFDITNPPFLPGTGTDCTGTFVGTTLTAGTISACNFVNGLDGRNNTGTIDSQTDLSRITYKLEGSITVSPSSADPGDTVTIQAKDFPTGALASGCCDLAGTAITTNSDAALLTTLSVPSSGELNFSITIPDGVPEGKQSLRIKEPTSGSSRRKPITVGGATVIATPQSVTANQRVTIIGTGYTEGGAATINATSDNSLITIGGETIPTARINGGSSITIDNGGNWSASLDLPISSATTSAGSHELKIIDSGARTGSTTLTFGERSMTVTPTEGQVGTDTTVTGSGFPGKNDDGTSYTVTIQYDAGSSNTSSTSATTDASGNWSVQLRVPTGASIPSTNTIKATFTDDNSLTVITTLVHEVPRATVTIDPISGPAGTKITATATGFKRFSPAETIKVSTTDVTPSPKPSTDDNGSMTFDFLIPGLDLGTQTVEVKVAGTTASIGITVTSSGAPTGAATPVATAVEPIGSSLVRAFAFNNVTKVWTFYDPRPEFSEANTIDEFVSGAVYWVNVDEALSSVVLNNKSRDLTCIVEGDVTNCWNLIVW